MLRKWQQGSFWLHSQIPRCAGAWMNTLLISRWPDGGSSSPAPDELAQRWHHLGLFLTATFRADSLEELVFRLRGGIRNSIPFAFDARFFLQAEVSLGQNDHLTSRDALPLTIKTLLLNPHYQQSDPASLPADRTRELSGRYRCHTASPTSFSWVRIYCSTGLLPVWIELFDEGNTKDTNFPSLLSIEFVMIYPLNVVPLFDAFLL